MKLTAYLLWQVGDRIFNPQLFASTKEETGLDLSMSLAA